MWKYERSERSESGEESAECGEWMGYSGVE